MTRSTSRGDRTGYAGSWGLNDTFWFFGVDYCIGLIEVLGSESDDG